MQKIFFFYEYPNFKLSKENTIIEWISACIEEELRSLKKINYIFCSDDYLLNINCKHLNHNYFTDIITFDQSSHKGKIEADIFISIDRIKDNAHSLNERFEAELYRVMIHGVLHLLGYNDKNRKECQEMRNKESWYIDKLLKPK